VLTALAACENRALSLDDYCPDIGRPLIQVQFQWEENAAPPEMMTVFWYNATEGKLGLYDDYMSRATTPERGLSPARYTPLCVDLYSFENGTMAFRGWNTARETFEVFNDECAADWYTNSEIPKLPNEKLIAESTHKYLYLDAHEDRVADTRTLTEKDTITLTFFPVNVLHEFTFLIHGAQGLQVAGSGRGGIISGQAGSYFPASQRRPEQPYSLVFSDIKFYVDGKNHNWTPEEQAAFTAIDPHWKTEWIDDWITGSFTSFGPADLENGFFRLVIGVLNRGGEIFRGSWGAWGYYAPNSNDEVIQRQLQGAWGDDGSWETQQAWRKQNGGYDIILAGHGGLIIPDGGTDGGGGSGGFVVDADGWGEDVIVK
jgi:hypothetical protein